MARPKAKEGKSSSGSKVAELLQGVIYATKLTHKDIAKRCGYPHTSNIVSMWVSGSTKIPLEKATILAVTVGLDPGYLLRLCLEEYMPGLMADIENHIGGFTSKNEAKILRAIRAYTKNSDPPITTKKQEHIFQDAAKAAFAG